MRLLAFFKREAVLTVAALCALATMVLVPPDAAYLGYIDLRVLCLLLCLMAVVAGFQSCGAFQWLAGHLLSRGTGPRALAVILVRWAIPRTSTFTGPMDSLPGIFSRWCCPWRGSVWPA